MKKHKGMRPHDIVILLKIAMNGHRSLFMKELASELFLSASEVSESLHRSAYAGLITQDKKTVMKMALLEFLQYGLPYVFPQHPSAMVRGVPTAYAAPPISGFITSEEVVVWPYEEGKIRGQALEPLYPGVVKACLLDQKLYEILSLTETLRIGRVREKQLAITELKRRIP